MDAHQEPLEYIDLQTLDFTRADNVRVYRPANPGFNYSLDKQFSNRPKLLVLGGSS